MAKLSGATKAERFQLTTDGFSAYQMRSSSTTRSWSRSLARRGSDEQRRYAPPRLIGAEKISISGNPEEDRTCTSHVERATWTLRGHLRRMTRLSNGFSRKRSNLRAVPGALLRLQLLPDAQSIRMTPAMAAGLTRRSWSIGDPALEGGEQYSFLSVAITAQLRHGGYSHERRSA